MEQNNKMLFVTELQNGTIRVISSDRKQMARWYALDYLMEKPKLTDKGYMSIVSKKYYFSPTFRKRSN